MDINIFYVFIPMFFFKFIYLEVAPRLIVSPLDFHLDLSPE